MRKRKGFCSKIGRAAALGTPPGPSLRSRALPLGSGSARSLGPASSVRSRSGSPPAFQRLRARPSAVCALSGGELAAPWPSPATSPAFPRPCVRWSPNAEREGEGVAASCPARRPAASRLRRAPPWGRLQCPFGASAAPNGGVRLRPRRRHSRRGPWCARSLAIRPARHRCSRACGLATTAVRCDCMQSHLPAVTCLLLASPHLAATCSPHYSARAQKSRACGRCAMASGHP